MVVVCVCACARVCARVCMRVCAALGGLVSCGVDKSVCLLPCMCHAAPLTDDILMTK